MITLTPAYGRDYRSKAAVQADWDAGKDFVVATVAHPFSGKYASKNELAKETKSVLIRYQKLTKVAGFSTEAI